MAIIVVAVAGLPVGAVQAPDDAIIEQVDALMTKAAQEGFGGAVVIERQGRMLLSKGYGLANRQTRTALTSDTIAPISSITKSFTALALVQLAAEGTVDLRLPGDSRRAPASARLSDVLVHHAGLAEYCGDDFVRRTKAEMIAVCTAQPLGATPAGRLVSARTSGGASAATSSGGRVPTATPSVLMRECADRPMVNCERVVGDSLVPPPSA